jgi:hypothetical protein
MNIKTDCKGIKCERVYLIGQSGRLNEHCNELSGSVKAWEFHD